MSDTEHCTRCDRELHGKDIKWLHLCNGGAVVRGEEDSACAPGGGACLGLHAFGPRCVRIVLGGEDPDWKVTFPDEDEEVAA